MTESQLTLLRLVPVVAVIVLIAVGVLGVRRYRADRDRRLGLFAFATQRGWDYHGVDPGGLVHRWSVRPFGTGEARRAAQVVTGTWSGHAFVSFDYTYSTEVPRTDGTPDTVTMRFRITAIPMPAALPPLEVTRESAASRVQPALGVDDIDLESEAFNRRFRVRCLDRKAASDVLHPRTMEALLRLDRPGTLRVAGSDLLAVDRGQHTPATVLRDLEALAVVVDGVPGFVWPGRR